MLHKSQSYPEVRLKLRIKQPFFNPAQGAGLNTDNLDPHIQTAGNFKMEGGSCY